MSRGMDEWTDGRADKRMDGWTDGRTDGRTDGWMDGRTDGRTDRRMVRGWSDGRTDSQIDRKMNRNRNVRHDENYGNSSVSPRAKKCSYIVVCPRLKIIILTKSSNTWGCMAVYFIGSAKNTIRKGLKRDHITTDFYTFRALLRKWVIWIFSRLKRPLTSNLLTENSFEIES